MPRKVGSSPSPTKKSKRPDKLTLQPLDFDEALAAMLNTPPPKPAKTTTKKRAVKKASK
jgi:hypothetical protein